MRIPQARILEWVAISFSKGSFHPGIESRSPALQSDSLPTELRGKPANHKANAQARLQGSEGRVCQQVELWAQHTGQQVMEPTLQHSGGEQQLGRGAEGSSWRGALVGISRGCVVPPGVSRVSLTQAAPIPAGGGEAAVIPQLLPSQRKGRLRGSET